MFHSAVSRSKTHFAIATAPSTINAVATTVLKGWLHKDLKYSLQNPVFTFFSSIFVLYLIAHTPCNNANKGAKAMVNTRATTLMIADSSLLSLNVLIADQEMLKSAIPQINIKIFSFIVVLCSSFSGELCLEKCRFIVHT